MKFSKLVRKVNNIRFYYAVFLLFQILLYLTIFCLIEVFLIVFANKFLKIEYLIISDILYLLPLNVFLILLIYSSQIRMILNIEKFAEEVEKKYPKLHNQISSSLSLGKNLSNSFKFYSADLISALFKAAYKNVLNLNISEIFDKRGIRKAYQLIFILLVLVFSVSVYPLPTVHSPQSTIHSQQSTRLLPHPKNIPQIFDLKINFSFPAYTEFPPEEKDGAILEHSVIKGTKIKFTARTTSKVKDAYLQVNKDKIPLTVKDSSIFSKDIFCQNDLDVLLNVRLDESQVKTNNYKITVIGDEFPTVNITNQEKEIFLTDETLLLLQIAAEDDFKVGKMRLKYHREQDQKETTLSLNITPAKICDEEIKWNLQNIKTLEGEKIYFWIEVEDNDTVSGPKVSRTDKYIIQVPLSVQIIENIKEKQLNFQERIENVLQGQKETVQNIDKLTQKIKREKKFGLEEKKDLSNIISQQQKIDAEMKEIKDNLLDLQDNKTLNIKTLTAIKELNTLLSVMINEDLRKALQKLQETIDKVSLSEVEKNLLDAKFNQEEFLKKIEQTLNLFKRAFLEERLSALAKQVDDLKKRQDHITEKLDLLNKKEDLEYVKKGAFSELSYRQRKIQEEQNLIEKEIKQIAEELSYLSPKTGQKLKEIKKSLEEKNIIDKMTRSYQQLTKFEGEESQSLSTEIADDLSQLSSQMKEAHNTLLEEYRKSITYSVDKLIKKGLFISQEQEKLTQDIKELSRFSQMEVLSKEKNEIQRLSHLQKKLKKYTGGFIKDVQEVANKTFLVSPYLVTKSSVLSSLMYQVSENIDDGNTTGAYQISQRTMVDINNLVKELLKLEEKTKNATAKMEMEEYLKKLEAMAQAQQELNLKTKMGSCGMPMLFDMGSLAYQQQKIREGLEKLLEEMKGSELPSSKMLEGVPKEMEDIEGKILKKETGKELEKKQERVLNKLLDAQRALQIQGKEEGYERETAKDYQVKPPPEIEYVKKKSKVKVGKIDWSGGGYPIKYKDLIEKYFKVINR